MWYFYILYALLIGGIGVALDNIFRLGSVDPALNPMYKKTFASHFALALWVTFISGPIALYRHDDFLYISGQSVLWLTALGFVLVYNRPEKNFGKIPAPWLRFRNAAELFFTIYVLFFRHEWFAHLHYQVLWWRLLDVLPRRLIRRWQIPDLIFLITGYITWVILCWYLVETNQISTYISPFLKDNSYFVYLHLAMLIFTLIYHFVVDPLIHKRLFEILKIRG